MEAKELMIGDWVQDITPVVIDAISNEDICTYRDENGYITANPSNLKPIPLTEELLIKNGWHRYYFGAKYTSDKESINYELKNDHTLFLCHYPDEDCFCSAFGLKRIEFRYVHQLQHALRLCGIDKTIEI
jgi:hypothetical protein